MRQVVGDDAGPLDPVLKAATDPKFGDYQANAAMALAKRVGAKPRELAERIVAAAKLDDLCEPLEIAGPGFINLRLRPAYLAEQLSKLYTDERLGIEPAKRPERVAIDFSSPNLAKEMHVGHLRSTITGDAIARTLEFLGHEVLRINHVGDWGTQFGMLLQHVRETQPEVISNPDAFHVGDLESFYREAKARFDSDPAFAEAARKAVVDLQSGDPGALAIWRAFCHESLRHCHEVYDWLGVQVEDVGESTYNEILPGIVSELRAKGLAVESEGAVCVFPEGFKNRDGEPQPMIVQKRDGGFNYDTTDLAALRRRVEAHGALRLIYITDIRQRQHFDMLFAVARMAGWLPEGVRADHLGFGMILGGDRRPIKTREGGTVKLRDLLEEAARRSLQLLRDNEADPEKRRGFGEAQMQEIARAVGIGAIKYADLSHNIASDYVFNWDEMLALEGNTGPYMMYAYARIRSIERKAGVDFAARPRTPVTISLDHPSEVALGKALLRFGETVQQVADDLRPNLLTEFLYDLSKAFSTFYDRRHGVRVIDAEPPAVRDSRLALCDLTGRTLRQGLGLLGISVVDQM